jgi:hypothetical protein
LASADGIVVDGAIKTGRKPIKLGFDLFADSASVFRRSFYRYKNGKLELMYQRTGVRKYPLAPILIPTLVFGYGFDFAPGFYRTSQYLGSAQRYGSKESNADFFQDTLGFNLVLNGSEFEADLADKVRALSTTSSVLSDNDNRIIGDYFADRKWNEKISAEDLDLALSVLQNPLVDAPYSTERIIHDVSRNWPERAPDFAEALFARFREAKPDPERPNITIYGYEGLSAVSSGIHALPQGLAKPYFSDLAKLADDPVGRIIGYRALMRLGDSGRLGARKLIDMIKDADQYKGKRTSGLMYQWQHPYLAGMIGLCRMGSEGFKSEAVIQDLIELIRQGIVTAGTGGYSGLTVNTLIALGADRQQVAEIYKPILDGIEQASRREKAYKELDWELNRAERKLDCSH